MAKKFRLVIWNCTQGLQKKYSLLQDLAPDIAIIPECADQATLWKRRQILSLARCFGQA